MIVTVCMGSLQATIDDDQDGTVPSTATIRSWLCQCAGTVRDLYDTLPDDQPSEINADDADTDT